MLRKLLKYDLENIFKFLSVFYLLTFIFGVLTRIFSEVEGIYLIKIIGMVCNGAFISMIFNILINNLMRMWVRVKNNFYGDASYLTHTLPVEKKSLYLSIAITTIVSLFISMVVIGISVLIAYGYSDLSNLIKTMLLQGSDFNVSLIVSFVFILFLEFLNVMNCGITGIILGHKMNDLKVVFSVIFGFVTFMVTQSFTLIGIMGVCLFNRDFMDVILKSDAIGLDTIKVLIYISMIMYTLLVIIINFVNIKLFNKGVNVE